MLARSWSYASSLLRDALRVNRPLRWALLYQGLLLAMSVVALPFDRRQILGLNPWIKPIKFEISVSVFLLAVALLVYGLAFDRLSAQTNTQADKWRRSRFWLSWGFAVCMTVENTIIALQSARGVRSHMNFSTVTDSLLFAVMGQFIAFNTVLIVWLLVLWCVARVRTAPPVTWGVRLGLLMLLAGSAEGVRIVMLGDHTVGATDGGAGLPFLNWSHNHGDLRVAHFFALHALEIFPLAGLLLTRTRWRTGLQLVSLFLLAAIYTGGVWWLFAEAMQGRPLLAY